MAEIFRLGVIADAQYADKDQGTGRRDYRGSLKRLEQATASMGSEYGGSAPGLCALLHLGDLIDGYGKGGQPGPAGAADQPEAASRRDLELVLARLRLPGGHRGAAAAPTYHAVGNHDHSLARPELHGRLLQGEPAAAARVSKSVGHRSAFYFDAALAPGWRLVVIDTTAVSTANGFRWPPADEAGHGLLADADRYLAEHAGEPNALEWNGGLGAGQLEWLARVLGACAAAGERAIVAGHAPLLPAASDEVHVTWAWQEVVAVLDRFAATVAVCLNGHDHRGGFARSAAGGVPHVTVAGMVEAPPGSNAFCVLVGTADGALELRGHGMVESRVLRPKGWSTTGAGDRAAAAAAAKL
eukprot:SAG22_NODE_2255_length_2781_cov_2.237882_3_plen_356_part_00